MQFSNHRSRAARGSIVYLAVDAIAPSAVQPRQNFSPAQLEELSRSIAEYGVLSPLTVRPRQGGYELVAGERRLRAARMAGLSEVPCIVMELDLEEASFIALVENLQRNDLDFLEEARGIAQLIRLFGLSQEECARRLGKSQSAVANKLRLLRLPEDVLNAMRNAGLTERHGRALLRLRLETGRTHQIRVHLQSLGCPIAGDYLYGEPLPQLAGRFALHAARMQLTHPMTGETLTFESPLPEALAALLKE